MYTNFLHDEFLGHPLLLPKTLTKVPNVNIGSDHQNILHEYFYYIATLYLGVADKIQKRLPPQPKATVHLYHLLRSHIYAYHHSRVHLLYHLQRRISFSFYI